MTSVGFVGFVGIAMVYAACASPDVTPVGTVDGEMDGSLAGDAWAATGCARCVSASCAAESARCRAEPTCARYLDCRGACPSTAEQAPEGDCAAACEAPAGSAAVAALGELERCRTGGAGTACADCPASGGGFRHPVLTQRCDDPSWDAGPDANAEREGCQRCVAERCCGSRDRCRADVECTALQDCNGDCSNDAGVDYATCSNGCYAARPGASGMHDEFFLCAVIRCAEPCGVRYDTCSQCLYTTCANEWIDCMSDTSCNTLFRCRGTCQTDACRDECEAAHAAGADKSAKALLCVANACKGCL
ncbi:MAG: hypothetical protein KF764_10270 [Labilithrix sp.]|nr:hypothetical protein [Labilithrix sp.]